MGEGDVPSFINPPALKYFKATVKTPSFIKTLQTGEIRVTDVKQDGPHSEMSLRRCQDTSHMRNPYRAPPGLGLDPSKSAGDSSGQGEAGKRVAARGLK